VVYDEVSFHVEEIGTPPSCLLLVLVLVVHVLVLVLVVHVLVVLVLVHVLVLLFLLLLLL